MKINKPEARVLIEALDEYIEFLYGQKVNDEDTEFNEHLYKNMNIALGIRHKARQVEKGGEG